MSQAETIPQLLELIEHQLRKPIIKHKLEFHTRTYNFDRILGQVKTLAAYLVQKNIKKGDKVLICGPNSPEWVTVFLTCGITGVIAVPLDFNFNPDFIHRIAQETEAKLIFTSYTKRLSKVDSSHIIYLEDLFGFLANQPQISADQLPPLHKDDIFEIVYTSGTTSDPKGVIQTHGNITANLASIIKIIDPSRYHRALSLIPLSHMFEQIVGFFTPITMGATIVYTISRRPSILLSAMQEENINLVVAVPAFLELLREKILRQAERRGQKEFLLALLPLTRWLPGKARRLCYHGILKTFGRLDLLIVGGAKLEPELERFWRDLGAIVLQGYGLTEATAVITLNDFDHRRIGTVGKPAFTQQVKIAHDGEILAKGSNITPGYYNNHEATKTLLETGWLHTGDIGELDPDGFLILKGRKKNMILTSSGLNVYPEDIESELNKQPLIKDSCVLGLTSNGDTVITGVVLLDKPTDKPLDLTTLINDTNQKLSPHQHLQKVIIWDEPDFPRTHTLKIQRRFVEQKLSGIENTKATATNDELLNLLEKVAANSIQISENKNLAADLGIDSLGRVELVTLIEEEYGIYLNEDQIDDTTTVGQLRQIIAQGNPFEQEIKIHWLNQNILSQTLRPWLQQLMISFLHRYTIPDISGLDHLDHIDFSQPVIFAANHTSHFDAPAILSALPTAIREKIAIPAKKEYYFETNSQVGWFTYLTRMIFARVVLNALPLSRHGDVINSLKLIGKFVNQGHAILIFPEGTRSVTGKMQKFKSGTGILALGLGATLVPIKLEGFYDILPKGSVKPHSGNSKIKIGKPVRVDRTMSHLEVTAWLKKEILKL